MTAKAKASLGPTPRAPRASTAAPSRAPSYPGVVGSAMAMLMATKAQHQAAAEGTACPAGWPIEAEKLAPGEASSVRESPQGFFILANPR